MTRFALALLACAFLMEAQAFAMQEPAPSKQDSRIRTAPYTRSW